jgi:hypothetical protein
MAWTVPRKFLPQENLTAAVLNTHLRDNLNATLAAGTPANFGIATTSGENSVKWSRLRVANKTTTSSTASTTPSAVGPTMSSISHTGAFLVTFTAELANSSASGVTYYMPGPNPSTPSVKQSHAVAVQGTTRVTVTGHTLWWPATGVTDLTGYVWASSGTASVYRAYYTFLPF